MTSGCTVSSECCNVAALTTDHACSCNMHCTGCDPGCTSACAAIQYTHKQAYLCFAIPEYCDCLFVYAYNGSCCMANICQGMARVQYFKYCCMVGVQVTALTVADIPASFISSQQSKAEVLAVLTELRKAQPTCKLLYVTPEQLVKSSSLQSVLTALHKRKLLARLVVDEVSYSSYQLSKHVRNDSCVAGP